MNGNEQLITRFYTAFQQLDYATMQDCYSEGAVFNDPVFGLLQGTAVKAMWEMLCKNAKDFSRGSPSIRAPRLGPLHKVIRRVRSSEGTSLHHRPGWTFPRRVRTRQCVR